MTRAERCRRIAAHARREVELFRLPPWHTPPVCAYLGDPPAAADTSMGARTWPKARALADELLAANPDHYRDLERD